MFVHAAGADIGGRRSEAGTESYGGSTSTSACDVACFEHDLQRRRAVVYLIEPIPPPGISRRFPFLLPLLTRRLPVAYTRVAACLENLEMLGGKSCDGKLAKNCFLLVAAYLRSCGFLVVPSWEYRHDPIKAKACNASIVTAIL